MEASLSTQTDNLVCSTAKRTTECGPARIQSAVCNDSSDKYKMVEN